MDFNAKIIEEFRAGGGRVGGPFEGGRLLLLTTVGARSGAPHTTPLGYLPDGVGRVLVIASAGGSPKHPDWFRNLVANPRVTVESDAFTYEADAVVLTGAERDRAFARAAGADPGWARHEAAAGRRLPVVALVQAAAGPPGGPASPSAMLVAVHDAFRRELELIRREVAATGAGATGAGAGVGAQLRVNCLTLCQGLGHHHAGEDQLMFPSLEGRRPGLGPALDGLRDDHAAIAELLDELRRVLDGGDPAALLDEVDRLTAALLGHLDREEERLVPLLDEMGL
ncbi:nitroreductase family deazaflavin-dependent oxidoreductase [Actinomadura decatromicini]|uniref:Nitroreductase family deazaflavin-dependent oxidoreductase n=1 Tax=Actinomadura decatromicini TaxID=2604572 RepID=A0A5D3FCZ5_9ACTN|nr:nitroreductase family deazaflavin-dependent oxidoreductase [Actinomadura decatromicini]TYK45804.1 nitroreductase family deazaflavin-dependent oxidoreductase [Actinomadura decatromicini]